MAIWQVQEAKTRLSELIEEANTKGPQIITPGEKGLRTGSICG